MSALGHKQTTDLTSWGRGCPLCPESGQMDKTLWYVCFVLQAAVSNRSKPGRRPARAVDRPYSPPNGRESLRCRLRQCRKPAQTVRHRIRQSCIEESDHRHLLLRAGREWGRNRRAAEQRDELASFHCPMPPVLRTERITHLGTEATRGYVTRSSATPSVKPIASVAGVPVAVRRSRSCQTLVSYGVTAAVDAARCGVACSVGYVAAGGRRPRRALGFSAAKRERHRTQYCGPTDNPKHNE